jgi:hypothetical protein
MGRHPKTFTGSDVGASGSTSGRRHQHGIMCIHKLVHNSEPGAAPMPFVSLTRLRVRAWRYLPIFLVQAFRCAWQAKSASNCLSVLVLREAHLTFWTLTVWTDSSAMKSFMLSGIHRRTMPRLLEWCDEASVADWVQESPEPPSWEEAHRRMQHDGRRSRVNHPSEAHRRFEIPAPLVRPTGELRFR